MNCIVIGHDESVVMLLGFCLHHLDAEGNLGESF